MIKKTKIVEIIVLKNLAITMQPHAGGTCLKHTVLWQSTLPRGRRDPQRLADKLAS